MASLGVPPSARPDTRRRIGTVLAVVALVGSAILAAFDVYLAAHSDEFAGLAIAVTHLVYGWIPAVVALVGVVIRATRLTVTALLVSAAVLIVPPSLLVLF